MGDLCVVTSLQDGMNLIEPRNADGVAAALQEALTISPESPARRMQSLQAQAARHDYRYVPPAMVPEVERIVLEEVSRLLLGQALVCRGVMTLEVLPDLHWDKGRAARAPLAHALGPDWPARAVVVYAGDDHTHEDAFAVLADDGITVKVGPGPTAAHCRVREPEEILRLLELLAAWLEHPTEVASTAPVPPCLD